MPVNSAKNPDAPRGTSLWWWVVGAFLLLITAWTLLINLASDNRPEEVPLVTVPETAAPTP